MDYAAEVAQYVSPVDEDAVAALESRYRLVLSQPDSQWVAFSDPAEIDRVKENFLRAKLRVLDETHMDDALEAVRQKMSAAKNKNRLVVYYLLADNLDRLDVVKAMEE